jgi:glyoxylase-like metal-dependent hydrolase (beta-lactamase superfamily II)
VQIIIRNKAFSFSTIFSFVIKPIKGLNDFLNRNEILFLPARYIYLIKNIIFEEFAKAFIMSNQIRVFSLETGNFKADGGTMFGVVPKVMWERIYPADENNFCPCACRSLLVVTGDRTILIDTGIGDKLDPDYAKFHYLFGDDNLLKSLKQVGFAPEDITDVILTHLHFDHCGGTTNFDAQGNSQIVFSNADIWVSKSQWNWAMNPNRREKAAYLKENLDPLARSARLKLVENPFFLTPDVELRFYDGHTKGLMSVFINLGNRRLVFAGDLLPAIPYIRLSFTAAYDISPLTSIEEKEVFLKELLDNDDILFMQHDINAEACTLKMTPKGIRENEILKVNEIFEI